MENEKFAHMEPSKEMLGLTNLEIAKHWNEPAEPFSWGDKLTEEKFEKVIEEYIPKEKIKVATGRKAGRDKKTPMESLKVQQHKIKLGAKRDEVNFVESILDKTTVRTIPTKWNPAIISLNTNGENFIEEAILERNLRKIQGLK